MKKTAILFLITLSFCLLAGCGTTYLVKLKSGQVYETPKEPALDKEDDFMTIKTKKGKKVSINKEEILAIEQK